MRKQKRETNGQYAYDGNLERVCVCGHTLGRHSAGSPADCLFYSLPEYERRGQPGADKPECGCQKFRESSRSRRKRQAVDRMLMKSPALKRADVMEVVEAVLKARELQK